ncbi:Tetratricopeptide repeat-containing protein [Kordiimonas lacus]|uniref:Tetratricopeptide repeat-containing protein n=2 Tax=Kordiimonas lacus TaxID=637679 RepID=A0A1G6UIS7_9PROT|nr:Tetratricopeptide repeat-containing protein [Kordiimonas lacus]
MTAQHSIGPVRFDSSTKALHGPGGEVKLEDKVAELLDFLCRRTGDVVSREEILETIWAGRSLSEQTVPVAISKLRKALRDAGAEDTVLQTVPKRGYRMVGKASRPESVSTRKSAWSGVRTWFIVALPIMVILISSFWPKGTPLVPPADAAKPGIILTVQDIRTESEAQEDRARVIALSELASYFLSQSPEVLVIRHWWNVDAPDPTGGIFTRYGAETPVYLLKGTLINDGESRVVTLFLSNPKTDEVLWSGVYDVADGSGALFSSLGDMFGRVGVAALDDVAPVAEEDDRYWVGRYLAHLSTEGAANSAARKWREMIEAEPDNVVVRQALSALSARWTSVEGVAGPIPEASDVSADYLLQVDRAVIALYQDRDAEAALAILEDILARAPGDHYALSLKAEALAAGGDTKAALEAYRKALRLAPFAKAYANRIIALQGGTAGAD